MELEENSIDVVNSCLEDYPEIEDDSPEGRYAAEVTRAHITEQTREGHIRCALDLLFYSMPTADALRVLSESQDTF